VRFLGKLLLIALILVLCFPLLVVGGAIVARMLGAVSCSFLPGAWSVSITRGGAVLVPGLILLAVLIAVLAKARPGRQADTNGTNGRISQEIHQGLARLEERVEALETLLLDRTARAKHAGPRRKV